jgi:hypothetical protein
MQISTKTHAKTLVSALRREIKALGKGPEALTHNDCLNLTAKALGFGSWNAWEASLTEAAVTPPAPTEAKYPLRNRGDFDFVGHDDMGAAFSGRFISLTATAEVLRGTAGVNGVCRTGAIGMLEIEHDGETDIDWNSQKTRKNEQGSHIWLDEHENEYSAAQVFVAPEECHSPFDDEELPVRDKLVEAFMTYFLDEKLDAKAMDGNFSSAEAVLGFSLTQKEITALRQLVG